MAAPGAAANTRPAPSGYPQAGPGPYSPGPAGYGRAGTPSGGYPPGATPSGGYPPGPASSGGYPQASPPGSRLPLWLALGGAAAVAVVIGLVLALSGDDGEPTAASTTTTTGGATTASTAGSTTTTSSSSTSSGSARVTDAEFDEMQTSCAEGAMRDCDALWLLSPVDSDYEAFGASCGERDTADEHHGTCHDDFPEEPGLPIELSDGALERLRRSCENEYWLYCDQLYWRTPIGSDLEAVAMSCGGRAPEGETYPGRCLATYGDASSGSSGSGGASS